MSNATVGINWFEIPVSDLDRAIGFYTKALGTEVGQIPGPDGATLHVFMGDAGPSGALWPGDENSPATNGPLIYLGCEDIDGILSRVPEAGGKVLQDRLSIGEYGSIALLIDSEGNRIGLHSES